MYVSLFVSERTPKKPKKQWYGRAIVVYLILQTILNLFLLYKGNYIFFFPGLITNVHTFLWNGIKRTFTLMNDKWKKKWLLLLLFFSSLCHSVHSGVFLVSFWVRKTDSSSHKSVWRTKQTQSWGANSEQQSRGKDAEGPCVFSANPGPSTLLTCTKMKSLGLVYYPRQKPLIILLSMVQICFLLFHINQLLTLFVSLHSFLRLFK